MLTTPLRTATIWGFLCFLLLYRTFPAEVIYSWQALRLWDMPLWHQLVIHATSILPALLPLIGFIVLTRGTKPDKARALVIPLMAWLLGRLLLTVAIWLITFKISSEPPFSGGFHNIVTNQLVMMYWSPNTLVSALIIVVCSYACWRERRFQQGG